MTEQLLPLYDRVEAPVDLSLPEGPEGIRWRPLAAADAPLLVDLAERMSRRDHPT